MTEGAERPGAAPVPPGEGSRTGLSLEPGHRHPSAVIDPGAELADSVSVGPFAVVGPGVQLEAGVRVGSHALVERNTRVGEECRIHHGAVLGTDPQDLKYDGEESWLHVGPRTVIREYTTLNRGTAASGTTRVGSGCLLMAYAHVAHDCTLGDHVILANSVAMGGHVEIAERTIVGGLVAIHQFVRIGRHAFIGGGSRVVQDVPPYVTVAGNPCHAYGINTEGLRRRDFDPDVVEALRRAYRDVFRSDRHIGAALEALAEEGGHPGPVEEMLEFIRSSDRGVTT